MKLYYNPISPFARKVMIMAALKNIQLEYVNAITDGAQGYTGGRNPLGKIPTLEWEAEQYLFDSRVICEYLDSIKGQAILTQIGAARYEQLCQHALGDGLSEAVYNRRYETVRPEALHWNSKISRHDTAIINTICALEVLADKADSPLGKPWTFGNLAIICALDSTSFRANHVKWETRAPALKTWYDSFQSDPHYASTYAYPQDETDHA